MRGNRRRTPEPAWLETAYGRSQPPALVAASYILIALENARDPAAGKVELRVSQVSEGSRIGRCCASIGRARNSLAPCPGTA